MIQLVSLAELRAAEAGLSTPFCVDISGKEVLECLEIYRHLPGKRVVFRARWSGTDALVKLFFQRKHFDRERDGLYAMSEAGVPCPKEIWSFVAGDEGYFLAAEFLDDAASLEDCYRGLPTEQLKPLLRNALACIGRLHRTGWMQADIHLDNFLLSQGRLYMIDGGGVCALKEPVKNISLFFAQMIPEYDVLIPEVLGGFGDNAPSVTEVVTAVPKRREWRIKRYIAKTMRSCTQFVVSRPPRAFVVTSRQDASVLLNRIMIEPEVVFGYAEFLKKGNTSTVVKIPGDNGSWVLKRYNIKNFWHGLSRCLRPSRASVSWKSAHRLELMGIATPRPLAMRENRAGPLRREAYLLTEWALGESLQVWVMQLSGEAVPAWLNDGIFKLFNILWYSRVSHGDMKATNLMVVGEQLQILDLDALRWHRSEKPFVKAHSKDLQRFMDNWQGKTWQHFEQLLRPLAERVEITLKNNRL